MVPPVQRGHAPVSAAAAAVPLLEREHELSALEGWLSAGDRRRSGVVLVEGPAGIGKSRLIAELRSRARSAGATVLAAHGSDLERDLPFGLVRQLFEPLLADQGERGRLLAGAAAPARAVFEEVAPDAGGRRVVRRAPRSLPVDGQPRRRAPAAAGRGRPALGRPPV